MPQVAHGSSPRVRGTPRRLQPPSPRFRFIPARAGNSCIGSNDTVSGPVHPRACGELYETRALPKAAGGSSPRVRGTLCVGNVERVFTRFIPARAGNSNRALPRTWLVPVHPRACGELDIDTIIQVGSNGSSPRVRGTLNIERMNMRKNRFIPARAGNSSCENATTPTAPVHPRACGELFIGVSAARRASVHPRACGELHTQQLTQLAQFGSSPRVRELALYSAASGSRHGSSPRVRGTLHSLPVNTLGGRFIPARAGNSLQYRCRSIPLSVHPRACGGTPPIR